VHCVRAMTRSVSAMSKSVSALGQCNDYKWQWYKMVRYSLTCSNLHYLSWCIILYCRYIIMVILRHVGCNLHYESWCITKMLDAGMVQPNVQSFQIGRVRIIQSCLNINYVSYFPTFYIRTLLVQKYDQKFPKSKYYRLTVSKWRLN
jgi:hypothetical protein